MATFREAEAWIINIKREEKTNPIVSVTVKDSLESDLN
jgi:hypothetical protein